MPQTLPNTDPKTQQPLFLIDGSGFIFRAFFALPPLTRPDGTPVGAVMGFCNMMHKLQQDHPHARMAVVFDAARRNFRNDIYADYKATRDETPPDLIPQFPLIREAALAFGCPALAMEGYEADDLIATYAKKAALDGAEVVIVSSDKDLMQLVDTNIKMYDPMKSSFISFKEVEEKFGVTPDKVVDVQALAGDTSDNVPGVPGIGIKTAAQLINEYGSLEALLDNLNSIKQPKRREALETNAELARISKKLVTLEQNVPVEQPWHQLDIDESRAGLIPFLAQQGFKTLLARVSAAAGVSTAVNVAKETAPQPAPATQPTAQGFNGAGHYHLINTAIQLQRLIDEIKAAGCVAIDTETTDLTPAKAALVGISLCVTDGIGYYIPLAHKAAKTDLLDIDDKPVIPQLDSHTIMSALKPLLEDDAILKIAHNLKYDWQMFYHYGITISGFDDTMLISYALDGTSHGHGLDELAKTYCQHGMISYDSVTGTGKSRISFADVDIEKAKDYAAEDADYTKRIHTLFRPRVAVEKVAGLYEDVERPLVPVIARMEFAGIKVDKEFLKKLSEEFTKKLDILEQQIHMQAGHPFNIASPKQLGVVLFDEMGLKGGSKTKTGEWSTAADVLEDLAEQGHDFVNLILNWRQLAKLKSTYTESLQEAINPKTGRVHTSFSLASTSTGRLSSSDPNLQNIPIRTEEGKAIRKAFVAEEGKVIVSVDYSQVELRLAAEMAGIDALKKAFINGDDIHAITASEVFGVPMASMTPELRRQAKAINFGIIYGISSYGLARQLGIEPAEAGRYIKAYFARFPELSQYMEAAKAEAREHGFVRTLFGRKCTIFAINDKNGARRAGAERQAINAPIQGTAADIMKLAMIAIDRKIASGAIKARMLLQVHDELVFEVDEAIAAQEAEKIKAAMEGVVNLSIPLSAEAGIGNNWADAH